MLETAVPAILIIQAALRDAINNTGLHPVYSPSPPVIRRSCGLPGPRIVYRAPRNRHPAEWRTEENDRPIFLGAGTLGLSLATVGTTDSAEVQYRTTPAKPMGPTY